MKRLKSILASNKFLVLSDQRVYSGASFLVTLLLARLLSTKDFGILSSVVLTNFLIISITNALVIQPFQVNSSATSNKESYRMFNAVFQIALSLFLILILFISTCFGALAQTLTYLPAITVFILGFVMHDFFRKSFLAQNKLKAALMIDSILALSQVLFLVWLHFSFMPSLESVILYLGLSYIPSLLVSFYYAPLYKVEVTEWKEYAITHLKQGSWLLLVALLQWGSNNIFVITSGLFLGIEALGALRLVQSLFGVLNVLLQTFENYVLPHATRLYQTSLSDAKKYLKELSLKGSFVFGFVLVLLFIFSEEIITWSGGEKYRSYHYLVKGMSLLYFVLFAGYPIRMSIRMLILNKTFFMGYVLSFVFTLISYTYLLKNWQLSGVIIGLIANQILMLVYWQYQLTKTKFYLWK